jgi:signal transduction histidine kinase
MAPARGTALTATRQETMPAEELQAQLQILQGIAHAFGSASNAAEAYASTVRWVRQALGDPEATVRILVPDAGELRLEVQEGAASAACSGPVREEVLGSRQAAHWNVDRRQALVAVPLVSRGDVVGLLEVVCDREALVHRQPTLAAVSSQAAILLRNLSLRSELDREIAALGGLAHVAGRLVRAESQEAAVRIAVEACARELGRPVAGWVERGDPSRMAFVTAAGIPGEASRALEESMSTLPWWNALPDEDQARLVHRFADAAGAEAAVPVSAGDALLFVAGDEDPLLEAVAALLADVLVQLRTVTLAQRRNEQLDMALAWTAHEFRSPLVAVQAALGQLLEGRDGSTQSDELLRAAHEEVRELTGLVEPLLLWAAGAVPLERHPTDLVNVVREAMAVPPAGDDRISLSGPDRLLVSADEPHVRTAISNVLRNALSYSPAGSEVHVSIRIQGADALVTIEDRGPGLGPTERETIFDPFMRGQSGTMKRSGRGLGLFIAKRVIEAHGGRIWVDSTDAGGASFHISLPRQADHDQASLFPEDRP